jgi:hypothetical protein
MSAYPDKPLGDINEIRHTFGNRLCYSCGDKNEDVPKQNEYRNGYFGPHCTARFTCQENRELNTPVCVYCEQHYIPDAHRYCKKSPTIDGRNAHSTVDQRLKKLPEDKGDLKEFLKGGFIKELKEQGFLDLQRNEGFRLDDSFRSFEEQQIFYQNGEVPPPPPFPPRGEIHIDHLNKKRFVSDGQRWLEISEFVWTEWQRVGGSLDDLLVEPHYDKYGNHYNEVTIESKSFYDY